MAKDIREDVLWIIESKTNEKSGGGTDLRILRWVIDGKPSRPSLEKRDWYLNEQGDRRAGKAKGFSHYDVVKVIANLKRIAKLMEINTDHLDEALQLAMFQDENAPPLSTASHSKSLASSSTPKSTPPSTSNPPAPGSPPPDIDF